MLTKHIMRRYSESELASGPQDKPLGQDEGQRIEHMDNLTTPSLSNMSISSLSSFICIFLIVMLVAVFKVVGGKKK